MTQSRKNASIREKELRLAIARIEHGRAISKATKLSVSAVAREAGVSRALIHNHYPSIAGEIRDRLGASSRQQRDAMQAELKRERERARALRQEMKEIRIQLAKLVSINEVLLMENHVLKAENDDPRVVSIEGAIKKR